MIQPAQRPAAGDINGFFGLVVDNVSILAFIATVLVGVFAAFAIVGIFIGTSLSKKIDGSKLKPAFEWFVLVMGIYIIIKETLLGK